MNKVRYCSNCVSFNISLSLKAGRKTINFAGKDVLKKERYFDTEDEEIQQALESMKDYGTYFYRSNEFDWMKAEAKKVGKEEGFMPDVETIQTISDLSEVIEKEVLANAEETKEPTPPVSLEPKSFKTNLVAQNWINKNHAVPYTKLKSKESLEAEYAKLGFQLKIENIKK